MVKGKGKGKGKGAIYYSVTRHEGSQSVLTYETLSTATRFTNESLYDWAHTAHSTRCILSPRVPGRPGLEPPILGS